MPAGKPAGRTTIHGWQRRTAGDAVSLHLGVRPENRRPARPYRIMTPWYASGLHKAGAPFRTGKAPRSRHSSAAWRPAGLLARGSASVPAAFPCRCPGPQIRANRHSGTCRREDSPLTVAGAATDFHRVPSCLPCPVRQHGQRHGEPAAKGGYRSKRWLASSYCQAAETSLPTRHSCHFGSCPHAPTTIPDSFLTARVSLVADAVS